MGDADWGLVLEGLTCTGEVGEDWDVVLLEDFLGPTPENI